MQLEVDGQTFATNLRVELDPNAPPGAQAPDFWQIVHGEHLVVVDRRLQIRGYFDASAEGMNHLLEALGRVANEP